MRTDQAYTETGELILAVSLELATATWKIALHDGRREKSAVHTVAQPDAGARLQAVLDVIEQQKLKWSLPASTRVVVSYEAGQDAFWICRALQARRIECHVVDPASIPVERHKRRAKTDRLDAIKLSSTCAPGCVVSATACTWFTCRHCRTKHRAVDARSWRTAEGSAATSRPHAQTADHARLLG